MELLKPHLRPRNRPTSGGSSSVVATPADTRKPELLSEEASGGKGANDSQPRART